VVGDWELWVEAPWRLDISSEKTISSDDGKTKIDRALTLVDGHHLEEVRVNSVKSEICMRFDHDMMLHISFAARDCDIFEVLAISSVNEVFYLESDGKITKSPGDGCVSAPGP
jgi:hypothetical protein